MAFAVSTSRALVEAVASAVPSAAISLPSTNATVFPSCVTVASPVIGPGLADVDFAMKKQFGIKEKR